MKTIRNIVSQHSVGRLKKNILFLEKQNAKLMTENEDLKTKLNSYESIIEELQKVESNYKAGIEEMLDLKEKYIQAISDVAKIKSKYSKEMKSFLKQMKREI